MKLFWKLYCSMVLMTVCFCSFGGYYLIYRQFESSLEKETRAIFEENDFLCHMVTQERKAHPLEDVAALTEQISLSVGQRKLFFRISDAKGRKIGGNGSLPVEALPLVGKLSEEEQGWELVEKEDGRLYLHGAAAMSLGDEIVFLENYKDVSGLYEERKEQLYSFYSMMSIFVIVIGLLSFLVARILLKPISLLSETTRKIADGELDHRVPVRSEDELGQLSRDFNVMADSLEQKIEELKVAAIRQEEFMGSFAHEMKTPMTSIIGYADLLRSMELKPEKVRENADYIFKEGKRLENLSVKMMDFIVLGKENLDLKKVSVKNLFERLKNEMAPIFQKENIIFECDWENEVLFVEEDLIITVCLNLLDNGRKAVLRRWQDVQLSDEGKGCLKLKGYQEKDRYCISVIDNGTGIPEDELTRITDAFYMVDKSRARAMGGAGLGLSICDKIIQLHGGELRIESQVGKGTTMTILLRGGDFNEISKEV